MPASDNEELIKDAWYAGFHESAEGWNSQYPFEATHKTPEEMEGYRFALELRFQQWWEERRAGT